LIDLNRSEVKTFRDENDLNEFLRSGAVEVIISIVPKMNHLCLFFIRKGEVKKEAKNRKIVKGEYHD